MRAHHAALLALVALVSMTTAGAQTTGLVPLDDLGAGSYLGFQGGLYPGGINLPPPAHRAAALQRAAEIVPRSAAGDPDPDGLIVMIAIGMSNTAHEFGAFERNEDVSPDRNARAVLMDTALGGQAASIIANPAAGYWNFVAQRLASMGLTAAQVQVAWLKEANANPPVNFPVHAVELRDRLEAIVNNLHDKFPNLKLCYVSSRTYGGYATTTLNPEPQAYESGFSVKWLIEDQIDGDVGLNHGQLPGPTRAPLLLWGPYLWADGTNPRSDGLVWLRSEFEGDGTHPSPSGEQKVAGLLSDFFRTDVTARPWWPRQEADSMLVTFDAPHDAHVSAHEPNTNFGAATLLRAQGGSEPVSIFLGLDAGATGSLAVLAKLSLRVFSGGGGTVSLVNGTTWSESTVTFNNAPAVGALLVELPASSRDGTIAAGVTGALQEDTDGAISFALRVPGTNQRSYHSEEAGDPPRLVLTVPCASSPDSDGDGRTDLCDCAPLDPTLFAAPHEIQNLRWRTSTTLEWDPDTLNSGSATRYDVMSGELSEISLPGSGPGDLCLADDLADTGVVDTSPTPDPGQSRFFFVRGDNGCGAGRYRTASDGSDRPTTICP